MIALRAPAKINLYLRVLGRRDDGYHEIESVMQMVGLYDDVVVSTRRSGLSVRVVGAELPEGPGNLVYDAASLLAKEAGVARGVTIRLTKRIPLSAGLGGGSSDAAATLIALNRLWRLHWSRSRLSEIGAQLGSDVPFFFRGPSAWVSGRGDRVASRPVDPSYTWAVLVHPGFAVSTRWAFEALGAPVSTHSPDRGWTQAGNPTHAPHELTKKNATDTIPGLPTVPDPVVYPAENTLESVTTAAYPVIRDIKAWLYDAGAGRALMSGSGATVFGLFAASAEAKAAHARLPKAWKGWVVRLLRRMPW